MWTGSHALKLWVEVASGCPWADCIGCPVPAVSVINNPLPLTFPAWKRKIGGGAGGGV